ncbi:long-chain fatty acid transport protein [Dysgonomonas sp. PFB1-18]|uniref:OmpP1/FadL family transporter n=1 Tax=unclassified Dysgonomonas TaxID=2630389 RepID=UPI002472E888|nr:MULTISPECIES: aromatic hydrocarbon degradation protein [unclassified Dysgonomonas]MDH6307296.1 long-chain fatty acid transport protein [Dysgonomonas sp. PF1-14]MDH6337214.1 long-chain fatty acid transport protein [Dysgonomonas sp. PF1-16]MDH6379138.1 long-chain fatty acid transport protein [Dysgonomonas sp. PFB1-18]MDH6396224.1 long-chain fatty acid transport protein [Dysgonomonas sp. PF1-23]
MNKIKLASLAIITLCSSSMAFAGGILTNTNQSAHFARMLARDASTQIDAVYTNPAGLVKLNDGFHFSFTNQSAFQTRTITSTSPIFMMNGGSDVREFEGTASAPIIPSLQGAYKTGKWVLSGSFAISGGGGKATFDNGLPSFEAAAGASVALINQAQALTGFKANQYQVQQSMKGSNFIFGGQLGGSYQINDMFSVYGGFRLNIVSNKYEGHLRGLKMNLTPTSSEGYGNHMSYANQILEAIAANPSVTDQDRQMIGILVKASSDEGAQLESKQSGWGVAPILGFNFNYKDRLNVGMKYEFKTALDVENNTKRDDTGLYSDGVNTAHDIPALFTVGVSYKILPQLEASIGYHHFFDSNAKMADDKQKYAGGTNEFLAGVEYQINRLFLVSAGGQITRYGVGDTFQRDLSFSCNSYSIGFGGAVNVSPNVKINVGYFWTTYSDYTKEPGGGIGSIITNKDVFSRTNKVFAAGVDFSF